MSFIAGYLLGLEDGGGANIQPLTITQYGDYEIKAPEGVDGYNPIHVNLKDRYDEGHQEGYDDFSWYARQFFIECGKNRKEEGMADEDLLNAYMQLNCAYFSGDLREVSMDEEIQNRWKEADPYTWVYIQTILQEKGNDYRYFEIDLNE